MGPEVVFREFASILDDEQDLAFASTMVQVCMLGEGGGMQGVGGWRVGSDYAGCVGSYSIRV
jgi:hypothetical protein